MIARRPITGNAPQAPPPNAVLVTPATLVAGETPMPGQRDRDLLEVPGWVADVAVDVAEKVGNAAEEAAVEYGKKQATHLLWTAVAIGGVLWLITR